MIGNPYAAQIQAGAAWLDEHYPGWLSVFAADRAAGLHMDNCDRCVLGHVLGSYWHSSSPVYRFGAVAPLPLLQQIRNLPQEEQDRIYQENVNRVDRASVPLGFSVPASRDWDERDWDLLGRGWQELIAHRLDAVRIAA